MAAKRRINPARSEAGVNSAASFLVSFSVLFAFLELRAPRAALKQG